MASTQDMMVRGSVPRNDRRVFGLCFEKPEKESIVDDRSPSCWQDEAEMGKSSYNILIGIGIQFKTCKVRRQHREQK